MDSTRKLLLLVEDNDTTKRLLARVLTFNGWDVETATTVADGLKLLATHPACVVLDLMLPDGGGEEVLRTVKRDWPQIRVVVTSGVGDEDRMAAIRELRPDAIVPKPIEIGTLLDACSGTKHPSKAAWH